VVIRDITEIQDTTVVDTDTVLRFMQITGMITGIGAGMCDAITAVESICSPADMDMVTGRHMFHSHTGMTIGRGDARTDAIFMMEGIITAHITDQDHRFI
jgi:hypothetical protein